MTLASRTLSGLLWLGLGMTLSATPMVVPGLDLDQMNRDAQAALTAKLNNPQRALEDLCFDPPYFLVLPSPDEPVDEPQPDLSHLLPGSIQVDTGRLMLPPASLALSGAGLIAAGRLQRRSRT